MTQPIALETMLTIQDVAELLRCSDRKVNLMISAGEFPASDTRIGNRPRWFQSTITDWQSKQKRARKFAGAR
jgi:excisionase family DNA binding protein